MRDYRNYAVSHSELPCQPIRSCHRLSPEPFIWPTIPDSRDGRNYSARNCTVATAYSRPVSKSTTQHPRTCGSSDRQWFSTASLSHPLGDVHGDWGKGVGEQVEDAGDAGAAEQPQLSVGRPAVGERFKREGVSPHDLRRLCALGWLRRVDSVRGGSRVYYELAVPN
jgi:hypothetical protein